MTITRNMIVKDVITKYPQTINVFGKHKVDFCCGGAHSIEQTARARGCQDIEQLLADLNRAVESAPPSCGCGHHAKPAEKTS